MLSPNVATAAGWGDRPPAATIHASSFKSTGKGSIKGRVDLTIPRWRLVIRGALWVQKEDGKEWIALPSREWTDRTGVRKFANILEFTDRETAARFQAAAIAAVRAVAGMS